MKKLGLTLLGLITLVPMLSAQTMYVSLNDLGPTPGSNEIYYVHLYEVEVAGGTPVAISNGADQYFPTIYFSTGTLQVNFSANIPYDVKAKIYRVKFKIERRLTVPPYTVIVRGDPNYSEWCNSDMFYGVSGFLGDGTLN